MHVHSATADELRASRVPKGAWPMILIGLAPLLIFAVVVTLFFLQRTCSACGPDRGPSSDYCGRNTTAEVRQSSALQLEYRGLDVKNRLLRGAFRWLGGFRGQRALRGNIPETVIHPRSDWWSRTMLLRSDRRDTQAPLWTFRLAVFTLWTLMRAPIPDKLLITPPVAAQRGQVCGYDNPRPHGQVLGDSDRGNTNGPDGSRGDYRSRRELTASQTAVPIRLQGLGERPCRGFTGARSSEKRCNPEGAKQLLIQGRVATSFCGHACAVHREATSCSAAHRQTKWRPSAAYKSRHGRGQGHARRRRLDAGLPARGSGESQPFGEGG